MIASASHSELLSARRLSLGYPNRPPILLDASLSLSPGELVVLSGGNGSGKSTLLRALAGLISPLSGEIKIQTSRGTCQLSFPYQASGVGRQQLADLGIAFLGQNRRNLKRVAVREQVALMVPGFPPSLWRMFTGSKDVAAGSPSDFAGDVLSRLGLRQVTHQTSGSLSLGQGKRLGLASVLAPSAELLLLDEPLSGLDVESRSLVLSALQHKVQTSRSAVLIVEHFSSARSLRAIAQRFLTVEDGTIVEANDEGNDEASVRSLIRDTFSHWESREVAGPAGAKLVHYRCPDSGSQVTALNTSMAIGERNLGAVMRISVAAGEVAVLFAPNGWGKTTLLDGISGLQNRVKVDVHIHSRYLVGLRTWERVKLGLGYLRASDDTMPTLSLREIGELSRVGAGSLEASVADVPSGSLSGGQLRFGRLCTALAAATSVFLADECLNDLDAAHAAESLKRISAWVAADRANRAALLAFPMQECSE